MPAGLAAAALLAFLCAILLSALAPPAARAQGVPILPQLIRPALDQRPIIEASRVSLRVVRPRLEVVGGRSGGRVPALSLNEDGSVLLTVTGDGSVRWWDLQRGVQIGGALGSGVEAVAARGRDRETEAVAVLRGPVLASLSPGGLVRRLAAMEGAFDASGGESVISADGRVFAARGAVSWRVLRHGVEYGLADSARAFPPRLSADGSRVLYRKDDGSFQTVNLSGVSKDAEPNPVHGCGERGTATVGALSPDGRTMVLGDADGTVCLRSFAARSDAGPPAHAHRRAHGAEVRVIVMDRGGVVAATLDEQGHVQIWSLVDGLTRVAAFSLSGDATGPLALDSRRQWIFSGEGEGTVAVYAYGMDAAADRPAGPMARIISMRDGGWMVVDRHGRFDGTQRGSDALLWAGDTTADTLPIDAFSESYFEPGLLAKLDDAAPAFLNGTTRNLPDEGYLAPPAVFIDAVEAAVLEAGSPARIRVRLDDPEYPREAIAAVRLYHNGKLLPDERTKADVDSGVFEFEVALLAGENAFRAVGVGPAGVESRPAVTPPVMASAPAPVPARMRVISVGINEYFNPEWRLGNARQDARAIGETLSLRGSTLFNAVDAVTLLDSLASAKAIKERIADHSLSARDVLVVFLAGHGRPLEQDNGGKEWYFLPSARIWGQQFASHRLLDEAVRQYGVSGSELLRVLTQAPAKRIFLVLDSCYSGAMLGALQGGAFDDAAERKALRRIARVGGIHVLAAARADEEAVELLSEPHGALTYLMLEGTQGRADADGDSRVTVREIVDYVVREMPLLSKRLVMERISQLPVGYTRGENFALAAP